MVIGIAVLNRGWRKLYARARLLRITLPGSSYLAPDPHVLPFGRGAAPIEEGATPHDEVEVAVLTRKSKKQGKSAVSAEKASAVHLFHFDIEFHNQRV